MAQRATKRPVIVVTLLNVVSRGIHFLLFLAIGNTFGASRVTDTVFLLYVPLMVLASVGVGVSEVVVMPSLHRGEQIGAMRSVICALFRWVVTVVPVSSAIVVGGMWWFIGFPSASAVVALVAIPTITALSAVYAGILNASERFVGAVSGPLFGAVVALAVLGLAPSVDWGLALVLLAFECGRLGGLRVLARRIRSSDDAQGANPGPVLTWAARNGRWQLMASLLMALNPLVDILFARTLGAGAVTTVEYASRLWNVIPLLFAGYLTLMYAKMSRGVASGLGNVMTRLHTRAVSVGLAGAAVTGVAMLGVEPTIQFVYGFGVMNLATRAELSHLLMAYLVGASPFVASLVYVRAFSAQGRVDVLAWVAVANVGTNLMLDAVLIRWVGLVGIGLATAGSYAVTLALFVWVMSRITPNEAISSRPD